MSDYPIMITPSPMRYIRIALLTTTLLSLVIGFAFRFYYGEQKADEKALLSEMAYPARFQPKQGSPPVYLLDNGNIAFNTYDIVPQVRGYAGPIKVLLVMDREGRIRGIRIIEHQETKNYVHYMEMPSYLAQFIGKFAGDAFEPDKDIDSITRATVSVKALADSVRESSRIVGMNMLGLRISAPRQISAGSISWLWYAAFFAAGFAGYLVTRRSTRYGRVRDLCLTTGIAVVGLYLSSPFSILHVLNLLLGRPSSSALWYVIVVSTLLSVAVAGRFYCGWICPFGALSEFIGRLPVRKWVIPAEMDDRWRKLKYILLGLVIVTVLVSGRADYGNYETYVTLFSFHGNALTWLLVAVAVIACLRVERFWCRYLCPVAALTGLLSRKAPGYPSRPDCPMANKSNPHISECIRCNRCYSRTKAAEVSSHD